MAVKRKNLVTWIVIAALVVAMLGGYFFQTSRRAERRASVSAVKEAGASLDAKKIAGIEAGGVRLTHNNAASRDDFWTYEDVQRNLVLPVSKEKVAELLTVLKSFGRGRLIEEKPADLSKYGLVAVNSSADNAAAADTTATPAPVDAAADAAAGAENAAALAAAADTDAAPLTLALSAASGEPLFTVTMARAGDPYAQFQNTQSVYQTDASLRTMLLQDASYWLDTNIFGEAIAADAVQSVSVAPRDGQQFTLTRGKPAKKAKAKKDKDAAAGSAATPSGAWMISTAGGEPAAADDMKAEAFINSLTGAQARDFSDLAGNPDMKEVEVVLSLKGGATRTVALYAFADTYFVRQEDRDLAYSYLISEYLKDAIFPASASVFAPSSEAAAQ